MTPNSRTSVESLTTITLLTFTLPNGNVVLEYYEQALVILNVQVKLLGMMFHYKMFKSIQVFLPKKPSYFYIIPAVYNAKLFTQLSKWLTCVLGSILFIYFQVSKFSLFLWLKVIWILHIPRTSKQTVWTLQNESKAYNFSSLTVTNESRDHVVTLKQWEVNRKRQRWWHLMWWKLWNCCKENWTR